MQLNVRTWGSGPRTALLVHGFSDNAETWWRVGPAIAALGYTVVAPDLRGHGHSPRADSYALEEFGQDLLGTVTSPPDVAIGHSLGALVLGLAAPQLQAARTVFVDPPWLRPRQDFSLSGELASTASDLPAETAVWMPEEIAVDLASNALLDPQVGLSLGLTLSTGMLLPPPAPEAGTVVLVPELDPVLPLTAHPELEALGYRVLTQAGVRHVMHRDDFDGFMELLRPQLLAGHLAA